MNIRISYIHFLSKIFFYGKMDLKLCYFRVTILYWQCKKLPGFPAMSKSTRRYWYRKFGFCYKRYNKNLQVHQQFHVDVVPQATTVLKNNALAQVFS